MWERLAALSGPRVNEKTLSRDAFEEVTVSQANEGAVGERSQTVD